MDALLNPRLNSSFLSSIPPFRSCVADLLGVAGAKLRCNVYQRGERIYEEQQQPNHVFALHQGRIRTLRITPQGKDVTLYLVEPGQLFGVDSIAAAPDGEHVWGHDAEAIDSETVVVSVPRKEFGIVAAQHSELMNHVIRSLWIQSQDLMDQAETRAFHDVRARVAQALLMLAHKEGVATRRGIVIAPTMTHEQMAALAGTRRESVTMALGAWRREGILAVDDINRSIIIVDIEGLAQYREGGTSARVVVDALLSRLNAIQSQQRESRIAAVELVQERRRATYQAYTRR